MKATGFDTANVDVGLPHDPKVRKLARASGDPVSTATTMFLYVCVVLASWESGQRKTFDDGLPWWWTETPDATEARRLALFEVGLLDKDGRLPERSWTNHASEAIARKARLVAQAAEGGRTTQKRRRAAGQVEREVEREVEPTLKSYLPTDLPTTDKVGRYGSARANGAVPDVEAVVSEAHCGECGGVILSFVEGTFRDGRIVHRTHEEVQA